MLYEYDKIAKRLLHRFNYKSLLFDDEAIGTIINALANADLKYDPSKKASLATYRIGAFFLAIKKILKDKKRKIRNHLSLNVDCYEDESQIVRKQMFDVEDVINSKLLTDRERQCIKLRYLEGLKLKEVSEQLGITKQAVSLFTLMGLRKLKKHYARN